MQSYTLEDIVEKRVDRIRKNSMLKKEAVTGLIMSNKSEFMLNNVDCDSLCSLLSSVINGEKVGSFVINRVMDEILDNMEGILSDCIAYEILNDREEKGVNRHARNF